MRRDPKRRLRHKSYDNRRDGLRGLGFEQVGGNSSDKDKQKHDRGQDENRAAGMRRQQAKKKKQTHHDERGGVAEITRAPPANVYGQRCRSKQEQHGPAFGYFLQHLQVSAWHFD